MSTDRNGGVAVELLLVLSGDTSVEVALELGPVDGPGPLRLTNTRLRRRGGARRRPVTARSSQNWALALV